MKIKPEHLAKLEALIEPFDTLQRRTQYLKGAFHNADKVKDLNKRYRWDLFWDATAGTHHNELRNQMWEYMNDTHIDTALKSIVKDLK